MIQLEHLRVLLAIADTGGFSAAARRLGLSAAAVTRAISTLEQAVGARLVHRTTRLVRLTDAGVGYVQDCRRLLADLEEATAAARGAHVEPQGELAVTAPVMFGRMHLAPVLLDFLAAHPKVTARILFVDRVAHLGDEGLDVALRIAELPDSSHTAVKVGWVRRVVVASPDYLARHGAPRGVEDLAAHHAIGFSPGGSPAPWRFGEDAAGRRRSLAGLATEAPQPRIRLTVNQGDSAIAAALSGQGLTRALSYQVRDHVTAGRLVRLLRDLEPPPIPVHLVYPEGRQAAAKVRAFVDFAAARLRQQEALREEAPRPD